MSRRLLDVLPDVQTILDLHPEELGSQILQILNREPSTIFDRASLFEELTMGTGDHSDRGWRVQEAVGEAISWLESEGLLAVRPIDKSRDVLFVTRRGREWIRQDQLIAFRSAKLLPANLLHGLIVERARPAFVRGEYDTAVFAAFKAVEVAVRKAAGLPNEILGINLMSNAFNPSGGPLSAPDDAKAEREAIRNLFAGAIGHAKNPHSHRDDPVEPEDACHLLIFASYLLRLVDTRAAEKALRGLRGE